GADGFQTGCREECTKLLSIHVTILINPDVSNEAGGTFTHKTFASNSAVRSHLTLGFLLARIKKMLFYRDVSSERVRVTKLVKTCLRQFHGLDVDAIMTERNETPALIPLAGKRTVQRGVSLTPISDFTGTAFVIEP